MIIDRRLLHHLAGETEPPDRVVRRLIHRVETSLEPSSSARPWLACLDDPPPEAVERLVRRVLASTLPARRSTHWVWVAAAVALVVAVVGTIVALRPEKASETSTVLTSENVLHLSPTRGLNLEWQGSGLLEGTPDAPYIRWERGSLSVEVQHGQGISLTVQTEEAMVRVVGTAFQVVRDDGVTDVSVRRGTVEVVCKGEKMHLLEAGSSLRCAPLRPARLLALARSQREAGHLDEALATTTLALDHSEPGSAVRGELLALKAGLLFSLNRLDEARELAAIYLKEGYSVRVDEMKAIIELAPVQEPTPKE